MLKTEKRKANVGERILITEREWGQSQYKNGSIATVSEKKACIGSLLYVNEWERSVHEGEYEVIVEEPKPKKSARITALETQVAALEAKVEALESAGASKFFDTTKVEYPLTAKFERESAGVDAILADIERKAKPTLEALLATYPAVQPTANEQRADVIKRAKAFVSEKFFEGNHGVGKVVDKYSGHNTVEFVVNAEKRTVVAILRLAYVYEDVVGKGIAKCDPSDVFNADIGKAIALARALGVEVPTEFVKAVQPTEVVVGMVVETPVSDARKVVRIEKWERGDVELWRDNGMYVYADRASILDDTDAVYE